MNSFRNGLFLVKFVTIACMVWKCAFPPQQTRRKKSQVKTQFSDSTCCVSSFTRRHFVHSLVQDEHSVYSSINAETKAFCAYFYSVISCETSVREPMSFKNSCIYWLRKKDRRDHSPRKFTAHNTVTRKSHAKQFLSDSFHFTQRQHCFQRRSFVAARNSTGFFPQRTNHFSWVCFAEAFVRMWLGCKALHTEWRELLVFDCFGICFIRHLLFQCTICFKWN